MPISGGRDFWGGGCVSLYRKGFKVWDWTGAFADIRRENGTANVFKLVGKVNRRSLLNNGIDGSFSALV